MGCFKRMLFVTFLVFGLVNAVHSQTTKAYDYLEDEDYAYGDYSDSKLDGGEGGSPVESNDIYIAAGDPPYFEESDLSVRANFGDDVTLNCDVRNFQLKNVVMWYKKALVIVNGQVSVNPHVEALKNNSIRILNAQESDSDDYYCVVLPENIKLHINLAIGGKLGIYSDGRDVTEKTVTFRQGESHTLECKTFVGDNTIKWSLNGERLNNFKVKVEGGKLIIDYADAEHAGIYQCLGDDGSKEPLHGSVTIDVQYAPKVSTHRHHVNTEIGEDAMLYCDYKAVPIAVSQWKQKDKYYLDMSSTKYKVHRSRHHEKNRTTLTVKDVTLDDLGDYECEVKNAIGMNQIKIRLILEPENPQFEDMKIEGRRVTLHWLVRSLQPLSEAIMDYKIDGTRTWSTESIISTRKHPNETGIWKLTHQIELVPGFWHAKVKTKNTHGWSKFSMQHDFRIDDYSEEDTNENNNIPADTLKVASMGGTFGKSNSNSAPSRSSAVPSFVIFPGFFFMLYKRMCHAS